MYSFLESGVSVKFCFGQLSHFMATKPLVFLEGSKQIPFKLYSHMLLSPLQIDIKGILVVLIYKLFAKQTIRKRKNYPHAESLPVSANQNSTSYHFSNSDSLKHSSLFA
jgi:hypothetical protein